MAAAPVALLPCYLVVGDDTLKRDKVIARLRARVTGDFAIFNLEVLQARSDMEPGAVLSSLKAMPMGGDLRLVIIEDAEKLPKPVSEAIVTYLEQPNPSCCLALVAKTLAKTTRLRKAIAKVGDKSVIDCASQKAYKLPELVVSLAASRGRSMSLDAAKELVSRAGESTTMLDSQVASLCELLGDATTITTADVERYIARTAEVKPWSFLDAVGMRDAAKAMELYGRMDKPSQVYLHSLVCGRLRELACVKSLEARGCGSQVASVLKRQAWQVRDLPRMARCFSDADLSRALASATECERLLKGIGDDDLAFRRWILSICSR